MTHGLDSRERRWRSSPLIYTLTIERVRELADERYPDDQNEAHQLYERATHNVRNALLADLRERGCPPEEMEDWLTTILQAAASQS